MASKNEEEDTLPSGHTMVEMTGEEGKMLIKNYYCYTDGVMRCNPGRWVLPTNFKVTASLIYNFKVMLNG